MSVAPVKRQWRPSVVDRLPDAVKEEIAARRRGTQMIDEILGWLKSAGFTKISRSSLGRFTRSLDLAEGRASLPPEVPATATAATAEPPPGVEYAPSPTPLRGVTSPAGGEVKPQPSFRVRLVKIRPKIRLVGVLATGGEEQ